jgi:hypothetical protein
MNIANWVKLFDGSKGDDEQSSTPKLLMKGKVKVISKKRKKRCEERRPPLSKEEIEKAFGESKSRRRKKQKRQQQDMPWFPELDKGKRSSRRRRVDWLRDANSLREEIALVGKYVSPVELETKVQRLVLRAVRCVAETFMSDAKVEMYGSNSVGISTFVSDVDLSLKTSSNDTETVLRRLAELLRATKWTHRVDLRLKAKIPIVHVWIVSDTKSSDGDCLEVDISLLGNDGVSAGHIKSSKNRCSIHSGTNFVRRACREFPDTFVALVLFVKTMLNGLQLDVPYLGTSFFCLCVYAYIFSLSTHTYNIHTYIHTYRWSEFV